MRILGNEYNPLLLVMYWMVIIILLMATVFLYILIANTAELREMVVMNTTNQSVEFCALYMKNLWDINSSAVVSVAGESPVNWSSIPDDVLFPFGDPRLLSATPEYLEYLKNYYRRYGIKENDILITPSINLS